MSKFLLILSIFCCVGAGAQTKSSTTYPVKGKLVKVKNWGSRSLMITDGFFDETKAEIIRQIGEAEYLNMIWNCDEEGWPAELTDDFDWDDAQMAAAEKKRNTLKMYQIASYRHKYKGKEYEQMVILRVPYDENKSWMPGVAWEGNVYFLLNAADVMPAK